VARTSSARVSAPRRRTRTPSSSRCSGRARRSLARGTSSSVAPALAREPTQHGGHRGGSVGHGAGDRGDRGAVRRAGSVPRNRLLRAIGVTRLLCFSVHLPRAETYLWEKLATSRGRRGAPTSPESLRARPGSPPTSGRSWFSLPRRTRARGSDRKQGRGQNRCDPSDRRSARDPRLPVGDRAAVAWPPAGPAIRPATTCRRAPQQLQPVEAVLLTG